MNDFLLFMLIISNFPPKMRVFEMVISACVYMYMIYHHMYRPLIFRMIDEFVTLFSDGYVIAIDVCIFNFCSLICRILLLYIFFILVRSGQYRGAFKLYSGAFKIRFSFLSHHVLIIHVLVLYKNY